MTGNVFRCPGLMNGAPLKAGYHSHMSPNGAEIVIFDTRQILPTYIVHFAQAAAKNPLAPVAFADAGIEFAHENMVDEWEDDAEQEEIQYF